MNGAGHDEVVQQADGYLENDDELVEELADTVTIESLLDGFIQEVSEMFVDAYDVSLEGNPVRTHLELVNVGQDVVDLAHTLKRELLANANRAEQIAEQDVPGSTPISAPTHFSGLRKQVIEEN